MQFGFKTAIVAFVVLLAMFIMIANLYQNFGSLDTIRQGEVKWLFWMIAIGTLASGFIVFEEYNKKYQGTSTSSFNVPQEIPIPRSFI